MIFHCAKRTCKNFISNPLVAEIRSSAMDEAYQVILSWKYRSIGDVSDSVTRPSSEVRMRIFDDSIKYDFLMSIEVDI